MANAMSAMAVLVLRAAATVMVVPVPQVTEARVLQVMAVLAPQVTAAPARQRVHVPVLPVPVAVLAPTPR